MTISIKEINGWIKSNDKNILSHALKNHEVELFISVKKANGVSSISTFTIIYLKAYENNKLIKLADTKLRIIPSKENTLKLVESIVIIEFRFSTRDENDITSPKTISPTCLIRAEIIELKYMKKSHIKNEKLINTPKINNLNTNW